jgi:two-component system sensor histidine kinase GlrK
MISDLLDLSRIESGHLDLETETLDLRREVDGTIRAMRALLEERQLEVSVKQEVEPALVRADGIRLWQILNNILSNAIRHSPHGGLIRVRIEPDVLARDGGAPAIRTSVGDEGPGISPEVMDHVFEPFFYRSRGDGGPHGAGLGLAIVKQLVELHGGSVAISSNDAGGTCLSFTLAAARPREAASATSAHQGADPARPAGSSADRETSNQLKEGRLL